MLVVFAFVVDDVDVLFDAWLVVAVVVVVTTTDSVSDGPSNWFVTDGVVVKVVDAILHGCHCGRFHRNCHGILGVIVVVRDPTMGVEVVVVGTTTKSES